MDGLDTYIDDYGKPDPLPAGMLRQMAQSQVLGLFDDEPTEPARGHRRPGMTPAWQPRTAHLERRRRQPARPRTTTR